MSQELLSVGQVGVDKSNKLGDTALMLAANHGHAHCVEALIKVNQWDHSMRVTNQKSFFQAKADTKKTNNDDMTVVDLAKDDDVVIILKSYNVIKSVKNGFDDEEYNQEDDEDD